VSGEGTTMRTNVTMTTLTTHRSNVRRLAAAVLASCAVAGVAAPAASADFGIVPGSFHADVIRELPPPANPPTRPDPLVLEDRAGFAPNGARVSFELNEHPEPGVIIFPPFPPIEFPQPDGALKNVRVDLPPGFVGNAEAIPTCTERELREPFSTGQEPGWACPRASHVGVANVVVSLTAPAGIPANVYNMEETGGHAARFAFVVAGLAVVNINADLVNVNGEYRIRTSIDSVSQLIPVLATELTLWGVPADHNGSGAPRTAFLRNPTKCGGPVTTTLNVSPWTAPNDFQTAQSTTPSGPIECENVPFDPTITVTPDTAQADTPTGLRVDIDVPQSDDPGEIATGHLDDAIVTLPVGMVISPGLASGLEGCSDAQLGDGNSPAGCPNGSKIGTVAFETPLLADPVEGEIFLGTPVPGNMFRLFLVGHGPGFTLKIRGSVNPDPQTGRIVASFTDNPELPFTRFTLQFKGGPRAPLTTPPTCGPATTTAALKPYSSATPANVGSTFIVSGNCGGGFNPSFAAGAMSAVAGDSGGFTMTVRRADGDQTLNRISLNLPPGLTGRLASVPLCGAAQAAAGTCGQASRIGTTVVEAGAGTQPFPIAGSVFLTEGYGGGELGLSIVVRVIAGPFDLGTVVVRAAIHVDERDAHLSVISDPLPQILQGIPLRLRTVGIDLDRPGFMLNPTNCGAKQIAATLESTLGASAPRSSPFRVRGCRRLDFSPKLSMAVLGRGKTRPGRRPGLRVTVRQDPGEANLRRAAVSLPTRLALEPTTIEAVCQPNEFASRSCPAASRAGSATARTPLLSGRLAGPVYLVAGRGGIPGLGVQLDGQVRILLQGATALGGARVRNTFTGIPDVPITAFTLRLASGRRGVLTPTRNLCRTRNNALMRAVGHNGKRKNSSVRVSVPCGRARQRDNARTQSGRRGTGR
jgi:hypothetical protein